MTPWVASFEQLTKVLQARGYAHRTSALKAISRPCVRIEARRAKESRIPIGASKLGGRPDVPPTFTWPGLRSRRPLSFIAQIDLRELAGEYEPPRLPTSGKLLFFCDPLSGGARGRLKSWVIHLPNRGSRLRRLPGPEDAAGTPSTDILEPCKVTFRRALSFPPLPPFPCSEGEAEWYMEQLSVRPNAGSHQMFGIPGTLQPTRDERHCLLLQVDSDPELNLRWGDQGRLFFWITKPALEKAGFEKAWATIQE